MSTSTPVRHYSPPTRMLALLLGLLCTPTIHAWERDARFGNVPFFRGAPMLVQKRPMLFASAAQVDVRLTGQGWFATSMDHEVLDARATALMRAWHGPVKPYGGVRDERYFLISMDPDVVVVAPFQFEVKYKTNEQMRGLVERVTSEVPNPMFQQLRAQQRAGNEQGLAEGLMARLPNPNFVELGCAFPDLPGAMLWAPAFMDQPIAFDSDARSKLMAKLGIDVRRHPRVSTYWQMDGCPT
jgi:hypothetical protein